MSWQTGNELKEVEHFPGELFDIVQKTLIMIKNRASIHLERPNLWEYKEKYPDQFRRNFCSLDAARVLGRSGNINKKKTRSLKAPLVIIDNSLSMSQTQLGHIYTIDSDLFFFVGFQQLNQNL